MGFLSDLANGVWSGVTDIGTSVRRDIFGYTPAEKKDLKKIADYINPHDYLTPQQMQQYTAENLDLNKLKETALGTLGLGDSGVNVADTKQQGNGMVVAIMVGILAILLIKN